MAESFADMLMVGGKTNALGRAEEVVQLVLGDKTRLNELYSCLFQEDAWVRMRAADALEKVCRARPDWLPPYIDKFQTELSTSTQPSIRWHLAQIYQQVDLTPDQKRRAITWLKGLLSSTEVDWITAANAMDTLADFVKEGSFAKPELVALLKIQQKHKSKSVVRRADKLLAGMS